MAATDWPYNYTTTNTTYAYMPSYTGGSNAIPYIVTSGGGGSYSMPAPRPQTALEWLDAEIEATCRLAREAG